MLSINKIFYTFLTNLFINIGNARPLRAHHKEEITLIQIIAGTKGKGKTKILIEKVNKEVSSATGNIVYLDKSNKHMYELSNKIRLINVKDYHIESEDEFLGFISGIISCDHDLQSIFLDSFLTIAYINDDNIERVFNKLEEISNHFKINICASVSLNYEQIPDNMKDNVIVSL